MVSCRLKYVNGVGMKHEKVRTIVTVLVRLGFDKAKPKKKSAHHCYKHPDGRHTRISDHGDNEIGGGEFRQILKDIGISKEEFNGLK